jgi:PqqA peptide cyclase
VQVSVQDTNATAAAESAGRHALVDKIAAMTVVKAAGLPLTLNVVLHARNIDRTSEFIELGKRACANRIELANTQYLGWALPNKRALLPSRAQLERAHAVAVAAKAELLGKTEVLFVKPDHFGHYPRACMDGWARRFLHVAPDGLLLPCHAAMSIRTLQFPNATSCSLAEAWERSDAFAAYRGTQWMSEPCASCEHQATDFGGCRCQAFALTGDASATDPTCSKSSQHAHHVTQLIELRERSAAMPLLKLRIPKRGHAE